MGTRRPDLLKWGEAVDDEGVTLVIGAPHVGKTEVFEDFDGGTPLTVVEELSSVEDADAPVVIDDFYEAYQEASDDETDMSGRLADADMHDMYRAALGGLARNDLEDAISTLIALWEERETVDEDSLGVPGELTDAFTGRVTTTLVSCLDTSATDSG